MRSALAAIAILAVGCGSGVTVVGLVLGPNISTGAAEEALRAPFLAQIGQKLDQHGAEPTAILTPPPSVTPPTAEPRGPESRPASQATDPSQATDRTNAIVKRRPDGMPPMMAAPVLTRADERLRCAHNAASLR